MNKKNYLINFLGLGIEKGKNNTKYIKKSEFMLLLCKKIIWTHTHLANIELKKNAIHPEMKGVFILVNWNQPGFRFFLNESVLK